ncbi:hypothetical protein WMY93_005181 [Mugilogobius chulae]|uniref:Uncharacterized protein n=1 Tax=Mugilogobius chulae TaxID=88201 RepID=A0AAW0PQK6_9GOBI
MPNDTPTTHTAVHTAVHTALSTRLCSLCEVCSSEDEADEAAVVPGPSDPPCAWFCSDLRRSVSGLCAGPVQPAPQTGLRIHHDRPGFVCMISGVFWSVCHSMKSKMYMRGAARPQIHIFTIDRPSSFPPSYEESQRSQPSVPPQPSPPTGLLSEVLIMAPPLYSSDSSEAPDCSWSWEHPPRYSQVEPCPAVGQRDI